jgi:hypothetical protein
MNGGGGGGDTADRLVPNSVIMSAAAATDNLYIEDFNLEPLQSHQLVSLPDMDALRLCRSSNIGGGRINGGGGLGSPTSHHHAQHQQHHHQLHALMPANPMLPLHIGGGGQTTATLQLADMQDPLRLGLAAAAASTVSYSHHHQQQQQQQPQHHSMKYPGTPPDTPPGGGLSASSPSPPYSGQISLGSPGGSGIATTTINVDVSEIVWRSYQDQPIDLRGQCDLGGRDGGGDLQEAKWLTSLEYAAAADDPTLRQISVVTGLPATTNGGGKNGGTVIEDEQVVSNFP